MDHESTIVFKALETLAAGKTTSPKSPQRDDILADCRAVLERWKDLIDEEHAASIRKAKLTPDQARICKEMGTAPEDFAAARDADKNAAARAAAKRR
jgi:hypothetical protein